MLKKLGLLWGFLFLLGGILGFVPGITKDEMFLGFFMVNTAHNILHIASGLIFLIAALLGTRTVRSWFILFGLFYAALSIIGFVVGDGLIFDHRSDLGLGKRRCCGVGVDVAGLVCEGFGEQNTAELPPLLYSRLAALALL